ncbi:MAG: hypothetical protein FJ271_20300 [Planctomycetes bacterium]|nr:hypothetical protein [Planctomycetota bacterium]
MIYLTWIKTSMAGVIWPGAMARGRARWTWAVHLLLVAGVVLGLAHVNEALDLELALRSPWPIVHRFWLPLLFLSAYAVAWLLCGLGKLLAGEARARRFADIDAAWREGLQALRDADIPLTTTPVYLVLGRPAGSEEALFQAAGMKLAVAGTPARKEAPLRIFAHRQGIYITCAGASLLGRQANHMLEAAIEPRPTGDAVASAGSKSDGSREMIEMYSARLHHVCRLIAEVRAPFGSINGMLMLVPLAASNDALEARQTARLAKVDLDTIRAGARVTCPLHVVVCDLEKSPGFADLVAATPPAQRSRALACRFPLVPDMNRSELPELVAGGVRWLLQVHLPMRIYPLLRLDVPDKKIMAQGGPSNEGLVRLLAQMHARAGRLAGLIAGVVDRSEKPLMLGGVFLAGTGADAAHGQAFVAEAFEELAKARNFVAWAEPALADETRLRRAARAVLAGAAVLGTLLITAGFVWLR